MEPVPPPHERSWRHPSELAPPPVEAAPRSVRIAATVTGAATIALVGLFALVATPSGGRTPVAGVASSSTVAGFNNNGAHPDSVDTTLIGTTTAVGGVDSDDLTVVLMSEQQLTERDVPLDGPTITLFLSDRLETDANVFAEIDGVFALQLLGSQTPSDFGLDEFVVATAMPNQRDQVVPVSSGGMASPVQFSELGKRRLEPGTPILDSNGRLVAICDDQGRPQFIVPDPDPSTTTTTLDDTTTTTVDDTSTTTTVDGSTTTTVDDTTTTTVDDTTTTTTTSSTTSTTTTTTTTTSTTTTTEPDPTTTTSSTVDDTTTTTTGPDPTTTTSSTIRSTTHDRDARSTAVSS